MLPLVRYSNLSQYHQLHLRISTLGELNIFYPGRKQFFNALPLRSIILGKARTCEGEIYYQMGDVRLWYVSVANIIWERFSKLFFYYTNFFSLFPINMPYFMNWYLHNQAKRKMSPYGSKPLSGDHYGCVNKYHPDCLFVYAY